MITGSDLLAAFVGALIFAILTARPGRAIGPRDEKLGGRERQAYFTYSLLLGALSYGGLSVLVREQGWIWLVIVFLPLIFIQAALQAGYYLFLTSDDE